MHQNRQCGMVAIVGKPNSGKSTLTNAFVGQKVSIVTHKPQTTRRQIQGVAIWGDAQVVFVDTPGIFNSKGKFEEALVDSAYRALRDMDLVLILVDPGDYQPEFLETLRRKLKDRPHLVVINKSDLKKEIMIEGAFVISALQGTGLDELKAAILKHIPQHPWLYAEDQLTNISEKVWSSEITREKATLCLRQEIPYELYVECDTYGQQEDGSVRIHHNIVVSADRYKPIVLGHKGSMIKKIGTEARLDLEQQLGCRVHLFLNVKVTDKWQDRIHILRREGIIS